MISRFFLILFVVWFLSFSASAQNLVKNGDFEDGLVKRIPKYWGTEYYHCSLVPGIKGKAVKIENLQPMMSLGAQTIKLNYNDVKKVSVSCYVKGEDIIPGKEDWNKANLQILFFDANDKQLDGWPEIGKWDGTFDWRKAGKNFLVPKGTVKAKIVFGVYGCQGTAYFDDIRVEPIKEQKSADPYNLLQNGSFEFWEKWAFGGTQDYAVVYDDVKDGNGALWINNKSPIWSFASQSVPLDGSRAKQIKISGYIKTQDVAESAKPWQMARVNIEFKDGKGKRLGGWPILQALSGTNDWKYYSQKFDVPQGTKRVDVFAGLLECSGQVWFDGLRLEALDANGKPIKVGGYSITDKKTWYPFKSSGIVADSSTIDMSFLLDAPAGKNGFVKARDGHFYFDNGQRIRFWGTNIYAPSTFPTQKEAELMADRLAKSGCNLVRIHHLDAFWANPNIFDRDYPDTQHLSTESLARLDYLIYQLKQKGIYVFMDLLVDREYKEGDGVEDYKNVERGQKITGFYNKRIIELQKLYAQQLLTHMNPYTGLRYVDDPAIVSAKLINEAMLFYIGTQFNLSKTYLAELDSLYNSWLLKKYGNRGSLASAWTDRYGRCDLTEGEDPSKGTVARADIPLKYQRSGGEKREPMRLADTLKFYEDVQTNYYKEMDSYLKSLGVKVPVSGSNHWVNVAADVKSNATLDYIDRHRYWDHPQFGYGTQVVFENQPMVKSPADALPNNFAFYRVEDKPFVISEWNCCFPNEYRIEGPMIMAAYANLQDWDGVLQFSFNKAGYFAPMEDNFDISAWPNVWSQWPSAAILFHRGDVAQAKGSINVDIPEADLYGPINEDQPIAENPYLPLITKTLINFKGINFGTPQYFESTYHDKDKKMIFSDNSELLWDYGRGIFKIDCEKTQAIIGFTNNLVIGTQDMTIKPQTKFSSIVLTSLDGNSIKNSNKLLLTAAARIENKGQVFNESKTQLEKVGTQPILVEGVTAVITLSRAPKKVAALDMNGKKIKSIAISGKTFKISSSDKAFFYEIDN